MKIRKFIFLFLMVLAISTMVFSTSQIIIKYAIQEEIQSVNYVNNLAYQETSKDLIDKLRVQYQNDEIFGILKSADVQIDTPLVQTKDNNYYLNHLINKKQSKAGAVFIDYRTNIESSKQINIYGHSSSSFDIPFNNLKKYLKQDFYEDNQTMTIITENNSYQYEIFLVKVTNNEEHLNVEYENEQQWIEHLKVLQKDLLYKTDVTVSTTDKILILQTCIFNNPKGALLILGLRKVENK